MADATQQVPLLNCVANQVLGYFGNAMVMPFYIPPPVAAEIKVTSRDIQEALLRFHREAFVPPRTSITLPARGMLGEAVLGQCNSAEKIDLTRFWNWQDSPTTDPLDLENFPFDKMPPGSLLNDKALTFSAPTPAAGTSIINIQPNQASPAPTPQTALTDKLTGLAPSFTNDMTGRAELVKQIEADRVAAGAAREKAQSDASGLIDKIFESAAGVVKTQKELQDAENNAADAKASKATADAKAAKTAGITALASNSASYIGVAGSKPTQAEADATAVSIVQFLFGTTMPSIAELAPVYDKYKVLAADDAATTQGKNAFLKALGF